MLCAGEHASELRLFTNHSLSMGGEIPWMQPTNTVIRISQVEFNPMSANQAQEYIQLKARVWGYVEEEIQRHGAALQELEA